MGHRFAMVERGVGLVKKKRRIAFSVFFFNDTATTEIYTLSLHDALPILPGISLVLSLILVSSMAAFTTVGGGSMRVADENGQVVQIEPEVIGEPQPVPGAMRNAVLVFLVTNIPTVVFGGIWLHYKGRRDTYEDLKRMRIEDLE